MRNPILLVLGVIGGSLLLMGGLAYVGSRPKQPITDIMAACVQHTGVGLHTHAKLQIRMDGQEREIPANIGVTKGCMRPLHTHETDHVIHMEFPVVQDVPLGQFFQVWGQPFSRAQILDRVLTPADQVRITVNGQEQSEFENLLLHDHDEIVIDVSKTEPSEQ